MSGALGRSARPAMQAARRLIAPAPAKLPQLCLRDSEKPMPAIGLGTFTGTRLHPPVAAGTTTKAVKDFISVGGRMIDCAQNYLNEDQIGDGIEEMLATGEVTRDELWVTSKLNNPYHRKEHVAPALEKSLLDLKLDYVDLYLMHWPTAFVYVPYDAKVRGFPMSYEPDQCSAVTGVLWKDYKGSFPPPHLDRQVTIHETWAAMVELHKAGLAKNIGICNFNIMLLNELLCGTDTVPHVLQIESHPYLQQTEMQSFCENNGIQMQCYSPLGYGAFRAEGEPIVLKDNTLKQIGEKYGKSIAQVALQWTVQKGRCTMPMSLHKEEMEQNLTVGTWQLEETDMDLIASLELGHRYLRPKDWYGLSLFN